MSARFLVMFSVLACSNHHMRDSATDAGLDGSSLDGSSLDGSSLDVSSLDVSSLDVSISFDAPDTSVECEASAGTSVSFDGSAGTFIADGAFAAYGGYGCARLTLLEGDRIAASIDVPLGEGTEDDFVPWEVPFEQEVGVLTYVDGYGISYFGLLRIDEISTEHIDAPVSFSGEIMINDEGDRVLGRFRAGYCARFDGTCL